jgi:CheY-like chemotaxis protein
VVAASSAAAEIPDLAGKTALVVDDRPANRTLMEMMLGAFGCTVVLAASGEEALAVAKQETYDMVFMDIQLPGINGIETMHRMREAGVRGPMIAITAYAMAGDAERFLAEGFDGYIAKPVRISEVLSYLEGM